jgi:hypothetical protein
VEIRADSLDFSMPLRGDGPRKASKTVVFPRAVTSATAGLTGYLAEYASQDDHHVGRLEVRLETTVDANTVTVDGFLGVRDWSGSWDDAYDGVIDFVVLAELESATAPPARPDLAITGMEVNQATQFFRASRYLDLATVSPDNSIFLIDSKNTGIRVYVDWDASAGLPPIARLTGELLVSNAAGTVTLQPINPGGAITPKRDTSINQAIADDTLNFMIPGALSVGQATVTVRVFDQADPSATSRSFTRTLVFVPIEPLNVFLVGIATQQPAAPAPGQAAITAAMSLVRKTYPRGTINVTGFTTTTLASQIVGLTPSSGCGQGWSDLLDLLRDLRGGSGDLYFGGLPPGIFASGVVGCSPTGERIAASFIDLAVTVPHEIGHALGRRHAPCRGCSPAAQSPDPDFPQYNTFNSDSIGVFGFDPATNVVFNPASTLDFMTAFLPGSAWISPYTHRNLLGARQGGALPGGALPGGALSYLGGTRMTLFLGLEITRDREVTRRCSFHHPAPAQGGTGCATPFSYELLDAEGRVLDCGPLHCPCPDSGCGCWPKRTRDAIPWPDGVRRLVVREGEDQIHTEEIPTDPPQVSVTGQEAEKDGVRVRWECDGDGEICYLVQVEDPATGDFRGLAPRQSDPSAVIPWRLFTHGPRLRVRILASAGIATGAAEVEVRSQVHQPPEVSIALVGVGVDAGPSGAGGGAVPAVASVLVADAAGRQVPDQRVTWYDGAGNRLGRGSQLDLRALPPGRTVVRAVARTHGGRTVGRSWLIDREGDAFRVHATVPDPPRTARRAEHRHPHPKPPQYPE